MDSSEDPFHLNDLTLADSFINYDYDPDIADESDPPPVGSGSDHAATLTVEQGIEKFTLDENDGNERGEVRAEIMAAADDGGGDSENQNNAVSGSDRRTTSSSTSSSSESDDDEIEEGEIVDSDAMEDGDEGSEDMISLNIVADDSHGDDRAIRSKNELETLPLVPPVNVILGPHHQMLPVGTVTSILEDKAIVEGLEKHDPLNEGSILWMTTKRKPLGLIDEVFGPVKNPFYIVRYNSKDEVPEGLLEGTLISYVPEFATTVLNNNDLHKKGYDASGVDDEEVSDDAEFSDDEKERQYTRNRKKVLPEAGSVSTLPAHTHSSPVSAIGQGLGGAANVNLPFPVANAGPNLTTGGVWTNLPHAPAMALPANGHGTHITGTGQVPFGATNGYPPFPSTNAGSNFTASGVWTNGSTLPLQQYAVSPNGFPTNGASWHLGNTQIPHQLTAAAPPNGFSTNGASWYPGNTQIPHQLSPVPPNGVSWYPGNTQIPAVPSNGFPTNGAPWYPGNHQNPNHFPAPEVPSRMFPSAPVCPGAQPNVFPPLMHAQGQAPYQYNSGASAGRGRWNNHGRTFQHGGRRGWQPWRPTM